MKANTLIALIAITAGFGLASCNKVANWRCQCSANGDLIAEIELDATKKKEAKAVCKQMESEYSSVGAKCKLDKE